MKIGIAGPIEINSLKQHLRDIPEEYLKLGLGGTAVNNLVNELLLIGHQVVVFTLDPRVENKLVLEGENLKIIIGHFRLTRLKMFDFCWKEAVQVKNFICNEKKTLDIVNAHWSYEFAIGTILAKVPHVITFRDNAWKIFLLLKHPYRFTRYMMDWWVRKRGKAFSFNSEYLKQTIRIKGPVIPNPFMFPVSNSCRFIPKGSFKIFVVANGWNKIKNPESAIEAFILLRSKIPFVELFLIGKGFEDEGKNYHYISKKFNIQGMHFIGYLEHEILLKMYEKCDLLLHTSREESFGNNLIEAMAHGIPVIGGKKSGAVPWVLNYGEAGILVDVENPKEIFLEMEKLIFNEPLYKKLSLAGIKNVKSRFSSETIVEQYLNLFSNEIKKQKRESATYIQ